MSDCPAVRYDGETVTRCRHPAGHPANRRGDVWHAGSGWYVDEDGQPDVYGCAWRYLLALPPGGAR